MELLCERRDRPVCMHKLYYFCSVETPLAGRGWERIYDQHSRSFRLKWVEVKSQIDYLNFREGRGGVLSLGSRVIAVF